MPPSRSQLPKRLRDSLERMAAQSGESRQYVTPDYDRILSSYQPESATGGGGGFGFKDLGSGLLNALSVPQAALGTALFKAAQQIPGSKAKDKDIPWRAALGDFYRDEKGRTGWQELTQEGMGLDSRQGFALGLVADPLWAVGAVTKPVSIAAKTARAADDATDAQKVVRALGPGPNPAPRYPVRQGQIEAPRSMREIVSRTEKDLRPIKEGKIRGPEEAVLYRGEPSGIQRATGLWPRGAGTFDEASVRPETINDIGMDWARGRWYTPDPNYARTWYAGDTGRVLRSNVPARDLHKWEAVKRVDPLDREYVLPDELLERPPSSFTLHRSRPSAPPKRTSTVLKRTKSGTFVGDNYFVALAKKPHRGKRQYQVFELAAPGTLKGAKRYKRTFEGRDDAIKWARDKALAADTAASPYAAAANVLNKIPTTGNISKGAFGNLLRNVLSRTDETKAFAKTRGTGGNEVYLRLGFGEKLSKDIKLGTTKARGFNNAKTGLMGIGRSPLERGAHQVKVSNQELTQVAIKFLEGVKKNWKKTLNLTDEAAEQAAQRVGLVAIAENNAPGVANVLRSMMKADGLWDDNYDSLLSQLREHWDEFASELGMSTTKRPGPYVPTKLADETTEQFTERWRQAVERGEVPQSTGGGFGGGPNPTEARHFESPFAAMTADEAIEQLTRVGLSKADAEEWVSTWQQFAPEASRFADETTGFQHELDIFKLAEWREKGQMRVILDRQIKELAEDAGIFNEKVIKELAGTSLAGPLAKTELGKKLMRFVGAFKTVLTTVNPSHFVRNATGDYWNHMINGQLRHLKSTAVTSKSPFWRIARGDEEALAKTFKVGDQEMTGAELFVEASFMGLGRGYVGSDIAQMMDLYQGGIHNWGIFKHGTRINMHRENAVRLETYIKHRQAGSDAMTAAAKSLRVHFDYSDLTDIEKVFARNLLLFYTWLRRNTMLQMSGVLTRPGMYSALGTMEQYRPKLEGEPDYLSKLGMVGAPGLGYFNIGNPAEAIHNFDPTNENFRQTILGGINPLVRIPLEVGTNQNLRTGYDISRGPGDKQPGLTPSILDALGFDMPNASFTGTTNPAPAMDPTWKHIIENLLLVGPQASTAAASLRPEEEYRPDAGVPGLIERLVGIRKHREDPAQAARNVLANIRDARREVDIRRKYRIGE